MAPAAATIRDLLTSFSPAADFLALSSGDGRIKAWSSKLSARPSSKPPGAARLLMMPWANSILSTSIAGMGRRARPPSDRVR
jgi:hypothetical protein